MKARKIMFERVIPYILMVVFAIRLFSYQSTIGNYIGLASSPLSKGLTMLCLILIWLQYTFILAILLRPFYELKVLKNITRFLATPSFILNIIFVKQISILLQGKIDSNLLPILLTIESILGLVICIYYNIIDFRDRNNYKTILQMFGITILLMIPCLPAYFVQFAYGYANPTIMVTDINFYHRVLLYIGIIVPFVLYFTLRNKSEEVIRFALIYISLGTMIGFLYNYNYTNFSSPWSWPFHLCNTAMFIIPLCLIFKMKRLFYFTYFINVLGALLAMLMPNYDDLTNIFSVRIFNFWYNHWIAFFMPLLITALHQFKKPGIKEFYWSMVFFFGYFVLVLFLNVYFTALGHSVDYFFLNSNYVVDKLGTWAENIFNIKANIKISGLTLEFHPIYQIIFFLVYVVLGLGVWFVYNEFYQIADSHYKLHLKLKEIKHNEYMIKFLQEKEGKDKLMSDADFVKLELKNLSKKYGTSSVYAVENANLEVNGGEIFGFLGPNGAGKSTIIKSIVGILPVNDGIIEICGYNNMTNPVEAKQNIGYVPDHYALYEKLTGREYINYIADIYEVSLENREERIEKYIKLFELEGSIDNKIRTYSHGMKQKITIMAALVHNPKVWILDEPLTGLDPTSIYQVKECMKQHAAEGNIVFFSSHIIDIVEKLCKRIAIIKKGHIKCVKTIEEIENEMGSLEEFYLKTIDANSKDCQ